MEELMEILEEIRPDVDFETEQFLVKDGILDSIDIIMIVGELNDTYDIEIQPKDLIPENLIMPRQSWHLWKDFRTNKEQEKCMQTKKC